LVLVAVVPTKKGARSGEDVQRSRDDRKLVKVDRVVGVFSEIINHDCQSLVSEDNILKTMLSTFSARFCRMRMPTALLKTNTAHSVIGTVRGNRSDLVLASAEIEVSDA
jgi:hypothetical protein